MRFEQILLLWLIREYGPVPFNRLWEWLTEIERDEAINQRLQQFAAVNAHFSQPRKDTISLYPMMHSLGQDMQWLADAGLIEVVSSASANEKVFQVTDRLRVLQGIFGISLTDILNRREGAITAYPFWGKPMQGEGKWAQVFVAMPFAPELKPVYERHILNVTQQIGVTCRRGDDFFTGNKIMDEVWAAIYHANVCIVDCTGRNPNVFYELGIAHTIGRPSILIAQNLNDIPFDVRDLRFLDYSLTPDGMALFEDKLKKALSTEFSIKLSP